VHRERGEAGAGRRVDRARLHRHEVEDERAAGGVGVDQLTSPRRSVRTPTGREQGREGPRLTHILSGTPAPATLRRGDNGLGRPPVRVPLTAENTEV
jgi:hypothetical protein